MVMKSILASIYYTGPEARHGLLLRISNDQTHTNTHFDLWLIFFTNLMRLSSAYITNPIWILFHLNFNSKTQNNLLVTTGLISTGLYGNLKWWKVCYSTSIKSLTTSSIKYLFFLIVRQKSFKIHIILH